MKTSMKRQGTSALSIALRREDMELSTEPELSSGQVVAIKKLHHAPHDGVMGNHLKVFTNEIRTLTEIRHRNIAKC